MKHLATFLYWLAAVFALALILVSFDYRFGRALFLATSLLPGMFCAKFFLPMALRAERRRVLAVICVVASTLIIEWMSLLLASFHKMCIRDRSTGGRATDWMRGLHRLPNPDKLRMPVV